MDAGGAAEPLNPDLLRCLAVLSPNETELQGLTGEGPGWCASGAGCPPVAARHMGPLGRSCAVLLLFLHPTEPAAPSTNPSTGPSTTLCCAFDTGMPTDSEEEIVAAARCLRGQGVRAVLVKLGARGSLLIGGWGWGPGWLLSGGW